MPGLPGVEQRDHTQLGHRLVERVERLVVRREGLQARVQLEPADAVLGDQRPGPLDRRGALARVDRAERDQHVVVARRAFGDLLAGQRRVPGRRGRVDGEHDRGHRAFAVVRGDVVEGGGAQLVGLEVRRRGVHQLVVEREVAVAVGLDVGVHVDRDDRVEVDRRLVAGGHGSASARRLRGEQPGQQRVALRHERRGWSMPASSSSTPATSASASRGSAAARRGRPSAPASAARGARGRGRGRRRHRRGAGSRSGRAGPSAAPGRSRSPRRGRRRRRRRARPASRPRATAPPAAGSRGDPAPPGARAPAACRPRV